MTKTEWLSALSEMFPGDLWNAEEALKAGQELDPEVWGDFIASAAIDLLDRQHRDLTRKITASVERDMRAADGGQAGLFDLTEFEPAVTRSLRRIIVTHNDGRREEHDLFALTGAEGANVLRTASERDRGPAATTLARCHFMEKLADFIEGESVRLGRPVSVAEVLQVAA